VVIGPQSIIGNQGAYGYIKSGKYYIIDSALLEEGRLKSYLSPYKVYYDLGEKNEEADHVLGPL
jgi:hypothetical protein